MSFQDLLNQPLPSANVVEEHAEIEENKNFNAEEMLTAIESEIENNFDAEKELIAIESELGVDNEDLSEKCGNNCATEDDDDTDDIELPVNPDEDNDEGEFDVDDLSDAELAALDAELSDDSVEDIVGDDEEEEELTPEEEIEADDMMKVAATTMLVNDELNAEEKVSFLSNEGEIATAINEGFLTETDVNALAVESGLVTEGQYTNKMIIKLDAASKKKQLYALAVNVSAAAHNDKDYIKLKKVMKMRKILRARLEKKYKTEATKRMKIYYKRLRNSKSNTLSSIGKKSK